MADIVFVSIAFAFFALCVLYVRWCDIIIGPDEVSGTRSIDDEVVPTADEVAA